MDLLSSVIRPGEVVALLRFKLGGCQALEPKCDLDSMRPSLRKCYEYLILTSRSFSAVIQALDNELRDSVCIFYLVLRALDTVEDDMTIPNKVKIPTLKSFYKNLEDPEWRYMDSKEKDRIVLEDFPTISFEFRQLSEPVQRVISDICRQMGEGMSIFIERSVDTLTDRDEYCHYVAGVVGIGLSKMFSASGLEEEFSNGDLDLANIFGLFLHKIHVIRDYLEDIMEGREFWPKEVWGKYAKKLRDFTDSSNRAAALHCLNDLITRTLEHIPDCIAYMSRLHNQSVFRSCAIPLVITIATLERCYNNPCVFTGEVKIRKGESAKMIMESTSIENIKAICVYYIQKIFNRIPPEDPNHQRTRDLCLQALKCCQTKQEYSTSSIYLQLCASCAMMAAIVYIYFDLFHEAVLD